MSIEYIRNAYNVPAKVGGQVKFKDPLNPEGTPIDQVLRKKGKHMKTLEQRLQEAQAEIEAIKEEMAKKESKFVWPLPEKTHHYSWLEDRIYPENSELLGKFYNQGLSEKRANKNREITRLLQDMTLFVDYNAPGWFDEVDWGNGQQVKHGILIDREVVRADYLIESNYFAFQVSCPTKEMAEAMLEIFGDRIKELFL